MDAGNWVALIVGVVGAVAGLYAHLSNHRYQLARDRRAEVAEQRGAWRQEKRVAYAALLAAEYAFFDAMSIEAKGAATEPPPEIDRKTPTRCLLTSSPHRARSNS